MLLNYIADPTLVYSKQSNNSGPNSSFPDRSVTILTIRHCNLSFEYTIRKCWLACST